MTSEALLHRLVAYEHRKRIDRYHFLSAVAVVNARVLKSLSEEALPHFLESQSFFETRRVARDFDFRARSLRVLDPGFRSQGVLRHAKTIAESLMLSELAKTVEKGDGEYFDRLDDANTAIRTWAQQFDLLADWIIDPVLDTLDVWVDKGRADSRWHISEAQLWAGVQTVSLLAAEITEQAVLHSRTSAVSTPNPQWPDYLSGLGSLIEDLKVIKESIERQYQAPAWIRDYPNSEIPLSPDDAWPYYALAMFQTERASPRDITRRLFEEFGFTTNIPTVQQRFIRTADRIGLKLREEKRGPKRTDKAVIRSREYNGLSRSNVI